MRRVPTWSFPLQQIRVAIVVIRPTQDVASRLFLLFSFFWIINKDKRSGKSILVRRSISNSFLDCDLRSEGISFCFVYNYICGRYQKTYFEKHQYLNGKRHAITHPFQSLGIILPAIIPNPKLWNGCVIANFLTQLFSALNF